MIFLENNFSLFGTVEDEKLFFKKMIFPSTEKNDFYFEEMGSRIFFFLFFDDVIS